MKKKFVSFLLILCVILSFYTSNVVHAGNYGNISEQVFVDKINSLRNTFVHGQYWNKYNGLDHSGNIACPCGHSTCPTWCSCTCGAFVYNGTELAWQCHGYALKIGNSIFGGNPNTWTKVYNANSVCAGDIARIDNDGHSIFIYKVEGDNIYYTDCNYIGRCMVNWNGHMTRSTLSSRLSWLYHLDGNTLTGVSNANTYRPIHQDNNPHVNNGVYTFKNAESGRMMNVYAGSDYNGNAVTIWQHDGTIDQKFRVEHNGNGQYFVYAQCSGSGRVLDILREGNSANGALKHGCVVDIYNKGDNDAQLFYIYPVGDGKYVFELGSAAGRVVAATDSGASHTDGSQLILKDYTGAAFEQWYLCDENGNRIDRVLSGISIKSAPSKTTYYVGESLSTSGLTLTAQYNDGSSKEITSGYDINYDFSTAGTKTVTVKYEGKTATFRVSVIERPFEITNLQSQNSGKNKIVTADVNKSDITCYLAAYADGRLVECDIQKPTSGKIELCASSAYDKYVLMIWDSNMKPLMNSRVIY